MLTVEFVPASWLEQSAWAASLGERLVACSRPAQIERRWQTRRMSNAERLLQSPLPAKAA